MMFDAQPGEGVERERKEMPNLALWKINAKYSVYYISLKFFLSLLHAVISLMAYINQLNLPYSSPFSQPCSQLTSIKINQGKADLSSSVTPGLRVQTLHSFMPDADLSSWWISSPVSWQSEAAGFFFSEGKRWESYASTQETENRDNL